MKYGYIHQCGVLVLAFSIFIGAQAYGQEKQAVNDALNASYETQEFAISDEGVPILSFKLPLYEPAPIISTSTNDWVQTGSMSISRIQHTSTLLKDGRVLVVGGNANSFAEIYDPSSGTFARIADPVYHHGSGSSATRLNDGRVLIVVGTSISTYAEIFDPATESFYATGNLNEPHRAHGATLLSDGKVLITGGLAGTPQVTHAYAELYDPVMGSFERVGDLNVDRASDKTILLNSGEVLVVGGFQTTVPGYGVALRSAEIYNPITKMFREISPSVITHVAHRLVKLLDGKILVAGDLFERSTLELFDPESETFRYAGSTNVGRGYPTVTRLLDGRILIAGGTDNSETGATNTAELYAPLIGALTSTGIMHTERYFHKASLLPDGRVLVSGGNGGSGIYHTTAELYQGAVTVEGRLDRLSTIVDYLYSNGELEQRHHSQITGLLDQALTSYNSGYFGNAIKNMEQFVDFTEQLLTLNRLPDDIAQSLLDQAHAIIEKIEEEMANGASKAAPSVPEGVVQDLPKRFALDQNYPNPFNPSTVIRYTLPESTPVRLVVYDMLGREVKTLVNSVCEAGNHEVTFDASDLPGSTYLYRLETPEGSFVRKMQLLK